MVLEQSFVKRMQVDSGTLVNDDNAILVGKVHDLLGVGIVRSSETVSPNPLDQLKVPKI